MTEQTTEKRKRRSPRSDTDKLIEALEKMPPEKTVGELVATLKLGKLLGFMK